MDLNQLKTLSQQSYDINLQKTNAIRKAESEQIVVYKNHIFRADTQTICFVKTVSETHKNFFILDTNSNPVEITDSTEFLQILLEKNQSALNSYHQLYQKLKNKAV